MPIKPENKHRYPENWKQIREAILDRAGHCCERCKVKNRTRICRGRDEHANTYMTDEAEIFDADTGEYHGQIHMSEYRVGKMVDIVLTIAHLDHTPENCAPENLRAWCQRCHLRYDAAHHAETAKATRKLKLNNLELFV